MGPSPLRPEQLYADVGEDTVALAIHFTSDAPTLLPNLDVSEEIKIKMVNLERWRIHPTIYTLDFQIVNPELEASYKRLADEMKDYYEGPEGVRHQFHPAVIHHRKIELAVVRTGSGEFKRIRILRLEEGQKWERNLKEEHDSTYDQRIELLARERGADDEHSHTVCCGTGTGGQDGTVGHNGSNVGESDSGTSEFEDEYATSDARVVLVDENVNLPLSSLGVTWFYLLERFCLLPFRTMECFLTRTGIFQHLNEFRDVAVQIIAEEEVIECKVDRFNKNDIPFVTLKSPKWPKTINDTLCIKTIESFPPPSVPPVGKTKSGATLVHSDNNGEVFLQFKKCYTFRMFERIAGQFTEEEYLAAKAKGPYALHHNTLYLAPYSNWYYRCHITGEISPDSPKVDVVFSDYGNYLKLDRSDLVPCDEVDDILNAFPRQVVRAQLRNIGFVDWDAAMGFLSEKTMHLVETISEMTDDNVACVELMSIRDSHVMMLSESLLAYKCVTHWSGELMDKPLLSRKPLIPQRIPSKIPMQGANWSELDSKVILAEPGAIIEVLINKVNEFGIKASPIYADQRLEELRKQIKDWYFWDYIPDMPDKEYKDRRLDGMVVTGKVFLLYPGKYYPRQSLLLNYPGEEYFSRVRVLDWTGKRDNISVHYLDRGTQGVTKIPHLHPLDDSFCELPAQGALLNINGFEQAIKKRSFELRAKMAGNKYLFKVESVSYEDGNERCHIKGDLFPFGALRLSGNSKFPIGVSQSMGPEEAKEINLGKPISPQSYLN